MVVVQRTPTIRCWWRKESLPVITNATLTSENTNKNEILAVLQRLTKHILCKPRAKSQQKKTNTMTNLN